MTTPYLELVNLTPHAINLPQGIVPPSGMIARVSVTLAPAGYLANDAGNISLVRGCYGDVTGLPAAEKNTMFIVSGMVRNAIPDRLDLASPANLVRDDQGQIIGCQSLEIN